MTCKVQGFCHKRVAPPLQSPAYRQEEDMARTKLKKNVKELLNHRVQLGLFTVPLWVAGAVYAAKVLRDRRRRVTV